MLNFGFVDYINSYPLNGAFRLEKIDPEAHLVYTIPKTLNQMFREKALDASFISLSEFLKGNYHSIADIGIAAEKEILSVNLYIKKKPSLLDDAKIGLTSSSFSSIELLKVLCRHYWKVKPQFEIFDPAKSYFEYDGILLIGDEALQNLSLPGFQTHDLAAVWHQFTGLPFVFAILASQKDMDEKKQADLDLFVERLHQSIDWGKKNREEIENLAQKKSNLPKELIQKYYRACGFSLDAAHKKAIGLFNELSK